MIVIYYSGNAYTGRYALLLSSLSRMSLAALQLFKGIGAYLRVGKQPAIGRCLVSLSSCFGWRFVSVRSLLLPIHGLLALLSRTGLLRGDVYEHLLSFKRWHVLYLADLFQVIGKPEQQHFSLFLKQD